jgi:peptidoglycan/LPS O-acetylase OafA/YrhL
MNQENFRPSINGLRGIAVLMVVLFHWSHIRGGFTGVDVFFVISGYLISGHIFRELSENRFSFANFYAKRTRRIIPSLLVILIFSGLLGWFRIFDDQFIVLGKHIQAGALFLSNFRLYGESGYFDSAVETKPLLHLWSLAIEEQFYLVWPILLWASFKLFKSVRGFVVSATLLSFLANIYLSTHNTEMDFYLLPSRLWELSFGYLVFDSRNRFRSFYDSNYAQIGGLLLILIGCFTIRGQVGYPGIAALIPVLGAGLILGATEEGWVNRRVLNNRFLGFFGTISFTLYLWHWPLFSFMKSILLKDSMIALTTTTLLLSYFTHRLIEKPLMRFPVTDKNRVRIIFIGIAALTTIAIFGTLIGNGTIHSRMRASSLPAAIDTRTGLNCGIDASEGHVFSPDDLKTCEQIRFPGAPVILFLGDSHAGCLTDGMTAFAEKNHFNFVPFTALYCTPLSTHDRRPACRAFNQYLENWITKWKPDLIILAANHLFWNDNDGYAENVPYKKFVVTKLEEFKKITGKEVLLVGQNPTWQISLTRVLNIAFLAKGLRVPTRTFQGIGEDSLEFDSLLKDEASSQEIPYFSIKDEICTNEGCRVRVGDHLESDLMEFDYGHLSHQGSLYVVENGLGTKIKTLIKSR